MDVKQKRHVPSYGELKSHIDETLKAEYGSSVAKLEEDQAGVKVSVAKLEEDTKLALSALSEKLETTQTDVKAEMMSLDESLKLALSEKLEASQADVKASVVDVERQIKELDARGDVSNMAVSGLEAAIEQLKFRLDEEVVSAARSEETRLALDALNEKLAGVVRSEDMKLALDALSEKFAALEVGRSTESLEAAAKTAGLFEAMSLDITEIKSDIARLSVLRDEVKTSTVFVTNGDPLTVTDGDLYIFEVAPSGRVLVTLPSVADSVGREIVFKLAYDPGNSGACHVITPMVGDLLEGHSDAYFTLDTLNEVAYTCCTSRGWILVNNS